MTAKDSKILVFTRGDHTYMAEKLAEQVSKVWLYVPIMGRQPKNREDQIGSGLDGVEKVDDFEKYKDKADMIFFPGEFDGELQHDLRKRGYRVFGAGLSEELELNRIMFLEVLEKAGLKPIKTYRAEGLEDAIEYLKDKENKWIKTPYCRGDFDTIHFDNMYVFKSWFDVMRAKLGERGAEKIELLIQDAYPAIVESGWDGFCVDGKYTAKGTIGYEVKDKGYIFKVVKEAPKVLDNINVKLSPFFKRLGYRGAWSTEVRINKSGDARFTDATCRFGSPPGEGTCEIYEDFAQVCLDVADGKVPELKEKHQYGAIIILTSWWNEKHEICVDFPKEFKDNVKLRHSYKLNGHYYCTANESDGYFGAVVAIGDSLREVTRKCKEIASSVKALGLEYDSSVFDKANESVVKGEQFGIFF